MSKILDRYYDDVERSERAVLADVVADIRERNGDHEGAERMRRNAAMMRRDPDGTARR